MKFTHYLYIVPLVVLAACSSEKGDTLDTSANHPNGAIQLSAGLVEGGSTANMRAGVEDNHANHLPLTNGIKLALRVSGKWTGHDPVNVVKSTTATVGATTGDDNKHNVLSYNPTLYWDDFGTADPANASTGRTDGLTIYGVAVNSASANAPAPTDAQWTSGFPWELDADQSSGIGAKDLLISNNVKSGTEDGTYKFADKAAGKLLEFRHAMSKITVNLTAGSGFSSGFSSSEVKLVNKEGAYTETDSWCYTEGTVKITDCTPTKTESSKKVITMANATVTPGNHATKEALVFPGSAFEGDNAIIARINADNNIYYVTAEKIRTAIDGVNHTTAGAYLTEAGKNYIINVTVNKTDIDVTATVTNWITVNADVVEPIININADWGVAGADNLNKESFSFYRSESLNNGYIGTPVNSYLPEESVVSYASSVWSMSPTLYWPNHNTHYQFRGVWPKTVTTTGDVTNPRVESVTPDATTYQVIKVKNVAYDDETFPSDLMIGRPEIDASTLCTSTDHTAKSLYNDGICATEGKINLNFQYMMSQVEVKLTTNDAVDATDAVDLTNVKVEIVEAYTSGNVKLGDREILFTNENTKSNYIMSKVGDDVTHCLDAIVPQSLEGVKFKITVYDTKGTNDTSDDTVDDIYFADVKPIKATGSTALVAPNGKWENGKHYVYNLKLLKTKVEVVATLTDWKTVDATENIWF